MTHHFNHSKGIENELTQQLHASQESLKKANEELNLLFNSIDEVLWAVDLRAQKVLQMSAACEKVYGYAPQDFINNINLWMDLIHPDDKKLLDKNDDLLKQGCPVKNQYRIVHRDGSIRCVEAKITPVLDANGDLIKVRGIVRDITKEKRANRALMENEYLFRQFFENAYEAIVVIDSETGFIRDYNQNALTLFKLTGTEILTKNARTLSPKFQPDGQPSGEKAKKLLAHMVNGENLLTEWVFLDADNKTTDCELRLTTIQANGTLLIRISILDITERKKAEEKLKQQQIFYSSLIENIDEGIALINEAGIITYQSPSAERISGFALPELETKTIFDLVHPDDHQKLGAFYQQVISTPGVPFVEQYRFITKAGNYIWMEGTLTNMFHNPNIKGLVANYRNIDGRKNAELKIEQFHESLERKVQERTAELVEVNNELEAFSYTVSHDLQAPLRSTCGFAKILLEEYKDKLGDDGKQFLQIIHDSSIRMSQLIRDLLDFSKLGKAELAKKEVDMNQIIKVVLDEVKFTTGFKPFSFVTHNMEKAKCDSRLMKQVWLNLIGNAVKYSGKKQNPKIEIGCRRENDQIIYYIKDNGAGFDMKYADKLFGVFKRMHNCEEFEGTGVGLATVQRIINRHGGRIWAEAKVNEGASFYFTLAA